MLCIGAVAGVFAVAGEEIATHVLGSGYTRHVGAELSALVVALSVWMVVSVGVTVVFPLFFVVERGTRLPLLAVAAVTAHVAVAFAGRALFGLDGLAVGLTVTTTLCLVAMLAALHALADAIKGLLRRRGVRPGCSRSSSSRAADLAFSPVAAGAACLAAYADRAGRGAAAGSTPQTQRYLRLLV